MPPSEISEDVAAAVAAVGFRFIVLRQTLSLRDRKTPMDAIQSRGRIIVGVAFDIPGMGYKNPRTGRIEGFEPDRARGRCGFQRPGQLDADAFLAAAARGTDFAAPMSELYAKSAIESLSAD